MSQTQIHNSAFTLSHPSLPFETLLLKQSMTFYITYDIDHSSLWFFCYKACQSNVRACIEDMTVLSQRMCPVYTHTAAILQTLGAQDQFGLLLLVNGGECNPMSVCICGVSLSIFPHLPSSPNTSPLHVCFLWSPLSLNNSFPSFLFLFMYMCMWDLCARMCMRVFIYMDICGGLKLMLGIMLDDSSTLFMEAWFPSHTQSLLMWWYLTSTLQWSPVSACDSLHYSEGSLATNCSGRFWGSEVWSSCLWDKCSATEPSHKPSMNNRTSEFSAALLEPHPVAGGNKLREHW